MSKEDTVTNFRRLFAAIIFSLFFSSAVMAQGKVMEGPGGTFYVQKEQVPPKETGVILARGIALSNSQLAYVMEGGYIVTEPRIIAASWGCYYFCRFTMTQVQWVIRREGDQIKEVRVDRMEGGKYFNPLLPVVAIYLSCLIFLNIVTRRKKYISAFTIIAIFTILTAARAAAPAPTTIAIATTITIAAIARHHCHHHHHHRGRIRKSFE
jgi:hypothetical protein